jgi:hypothetical protein
MADAPKLHRVLPSHGPLAGGVTIRVEGENLASVERLLLAGRPVRIDGASDREITFELPRGMQAGLVDLTLEHQGRATTRPRAFSYDASQNLKIRSVSPRRGPSGTELTVVAEGAVPESRVSVGGARPLSVSMSDDGALLVMVPHAEPGRLVDIEVENPDGQRAVAVRAFRYE